MDEGKIIFQVTKIGMAVNSKWKVFVDGKYVGDIDFKKDLQVTTSKGQHKVQYKVGAQSTKVLDVNVGDEDVMVECVFDGTVRNFHVIGGTDVNLADVNMNGTNGENVSASIAVANAETKKSKNKLSGLDVFFIIFGVVIVLGIGGVLIGGSEENEDNQENIQVSSESQKEENNEEYHDFIDTTSSCFTGAVFDCSYSDAKSIIGKTLSIGDLNSSSGGWKMVSQTSEYTEYSIVSTTGVWGIVLGVNSNDKVFMVTIRSYGINSGEVTDYEIECFAKVFAGIIGNSSESVVSTFKNIYADLYNSGSNKVASFDKGVCGTYTKSNNIHEFSLISMTEEYYNNNYVR